MYQADTQTGETIFTLQPSQPASRVFLVSHDAGDVGRVPMESHQGCWMTRLKLKASLFVYRFEVDGRAFWDRDSGKVRMEDGRAWSLAVLTARALRQRALTPAI